MATPEAGFADLGFARVDTHRAARTGDPEVVYGAGKTAEQSVDLLGTLHAAHPDRAVLATRLPDGVGRRGARGVPGRGARPGRADGDPRTAARPARARSASWPPGPPTGRSPPRPR